MPRFRLTLEYVGTRYRGWQVQKNARTVAGELRQAVRTAAGREPGELYGSGRTDAGVHALQQVAHLDLETRLAPAELLWRINQELPPDINVLLLQPAGRRFHARHAATARSYLYQIARRRTALGKPFVWWVKDGLSAPAMAEAAERFVGLHDFASFTDQDPEEGSTRVRVQSVEVREDGSLILIRILGSHFLWKMVRRMVGVLAETGRGTLGADDVARLLRERSDAPARLTAPPSGLFLERVFYEGDDGIGPLRPVLAL
ncbi:MAG TPA: tRNA pseudouridine(38-40) synthase TruA [Vicinamibacteria bacterium]|nr:tRNA pseudouridine(38-40) synthase TruA [Vicinamibacteria bacterium]